MTSALASKQDQTLTTTDIMGDFQIPEIAHGGRGRGLADEPSHSIAL